MDYFFYNTDSKAIVEQPRPRFRVLIDNGFAAVGGDRPRFGVQLEQLGQDDVLLMYENRVGVVAVGRVKAPWDGLSHKKPLYYTPAEMKGLTDGEFEYRIAVDWFLDLSSFPIGVEEIRGRLRYTPRGTVRRIVERRGMVAQMIEKVRTTALLLPEEIREPGLFVEGASHQVMVNAYERSPAARTACIAHYGSTCLVCGFNFGAVYGPLGEGFVHIHHLKPLAEIGERYEVHPITDLRPVCPNCHAIIHLGGGCRGIEEARRLVDPRVLAFWASFAEQIAATAHRPRD